ncbi:MAG: DUF4231 domain-containing protein [Anaerolineales bacterium]|jgi:hypothetical protein
MKGKIHAFRKKVNGKRGKFKMSSEENEKIGLVARAVRLPSAIFFGIGIILVGISILVGVVYHEEILSLIYGGLGTVILIAVFLYSPTSNHSTSKHQRDTEAYIEDRVEYKINRYGEKADRYRNLYWAMASIAAIGSALVPALINIPEIDKLFPTIVSLIVAITVALDRVFRPREIWRNYDLVSAVIREEEMRYSTKTGDYAITKPDQDRIAFETFVDRVEDAIAREREETILLRTSPPKEGNQENG